MNLNPENGDILDLSFCNDVKIDIHAPVEIDQDYLELIEQLKEQGYDILNPNDSFYNDICTTYSYVNNNNVILKDRKIDFYKPNLTLCEETCNYKSFDINTSKVICECQIKTEINSNVSESKFSPNILFEQFYSFEKYTNYKILKCYYLVFDLDKLKKNFGSYIFIILIICFIVVLIFIFLTQDKKYEEILDAIIYVNLTMDQKLNEEKEDIKEESKENEKIKQNNNNKNETKKNNDINKLSSNTDGKMIHTEQNKQKDNKNVILYLDKDNRKKKSRNYKIVNMLNEKAFKNNNTNPNKKIIKNNVGVDKLETNGENKIINPTDIIEDSTKSKDHNKKNKVKLIINSENDKLNKYNDNKDKKIYLNNSINANDMNKSSIKSININNNKNRNSIINLEKRYRYNFRNKRTEINTTNNVSFNETINDNKIYDKKNLENNERILKILKKIPQSERYKYFVENELNKLKYDYAVNIDFRSFFPCYWSVIKQIHPFIFTFITKNDYNLFLSKLSLFIMSFGLNITINTLFFTDDSIHKLYENYGKYNFLYNLPKTLYSVVLTSFITFWFELLSLSQDVMSKFKEKEYIKDIICEKKKRIKYLRTKNIIYFFILLILLLFFWYYLSCFCAVYYNTQIALMKDILISFANGFIYPFILTFIPTIIRIPSLRKKNSCLYRFSRIITSALSLI